MNNSPPRITFDTNVLDILHTPDREPEHMDPTDARALRKAIVDGRLLARVSEASVFVECLSFEDKLAYLAVVLTNNPRPSPDPKRVAVFSDLASIGIKMLHAPIVGAEKFIDVMEWAPDDLLPANERNERFGAFCRPYPRHQPLVTYGNNLLLGQPPVPAGKVTRTGPNSHSRELPQGWAIALKRAWDNAAASDRKQVRKVVGPIIGEWCDVLILGSHLAYGNDVFCTADRGESAGSNSLLFHGNRVNLASQGIIIKSPTEVLAMIS
ncbi:hypothetical protein [Rhizobium ecuadorense]|uniref:hypothetical protein n=1 Tax=Rhizobium ecuadorense TaxID=1671795 RepID=UPI000673B940|nr:hypothetical protein [Rhizobium ecuadorense]